MPLTARDVMHYHVFVASPGDVNEERQAVRDFFQAYNRSFAEPRGLSFDVVDWENYSTAGVGRPQELITQQTLERFRPSLALVIGIMAQRFGSPSGTHESGTEEEFEWAQRHVVSGFPEIKWFFRDVKKLELDPGDLHSAVAQWERVKAFRERVAVNRAVYARSYSNLADFRALLEQDLGRWLNDEKRPWFTPVAFVRRNDDGWPTDALERIAARLNDEFIRHISAGEQIPEYQARARYVQRLIRLRSNTARPTSSSTATTDPREGPLSDFVASDGAQLLVLGAGGSGKTTLLKHLAAEGATRATRDRSQPVFVYARLSSFDRAEGGFEALLAHLSLASHIDRQEFEDRWRIGPRPIVFLLDALNEVATAYQATCTQALWTLLQNSYSAHRYVVTSRPGGELESVAANGIDQHQLRVGNLLEFGPTQVDEYLDAQGRPELKSRLSQPLQALASNPFLLWAITRTLSDSPHVKNRGTLFKALIDDYIFIKRERNKPVPRPTTYNYQLVKQPVLAGLALNMIEQGVTEIPDAPELWQRVARQLIDLERTHSRALPLEPDTFMPKEYAAATLLWEIIDNGILVRDGGRLRFMHESVQEYFAAVAVCDSLGGDLADKVGSLNLAYLDARGPAFETLVTWAGFAPRQAVAALVEHLNESHPLLAAHLAAEAELPEGDRQPLRKKFLSYAESRHEQRQRLGAMGLRIIPSRDEETVSCLVRMLNGETADIASQALQSMATHNVVAAIVDGWLTTDAEIHAKHVDLVRKITDEHAQVVAQVLVDAWSSNESRRDHIATLAAALDARANWDRRPPKFQKMLMTLAAEEELYGDRQRCATIEALRQAAERTPPPPVGIKGAAAQTIAVLKDVTAFLDEKDRLTSDYARYTDEALAALVATGTSTERVAALELLVTRGSHAAVQPIVEAVLNDTPRARSKWLSALSSLPRNAVQSYLADQAKSLERERASYAGLLSALLADCPSRAALESVFAEGAKELRAFGAQLAARADAEAIELLTAQLENEASSSVLNALLKAIGAAHSNAANAKLLELLFDRSSRRHWPHGHEELIRDEDTGAGLLSDSWATSIHRVLCDAGQEDAILERAESELASHESERVTSAVDAARRCLPAPRAVAMLWHATTHSDIDIRQRALWSLACAGHSDAWRSLLEADLDAPSRFVGFAQDVARRLQSAALEPATAAGFAFGSRSVLRPVLFSPDVTRRNLAVYLTARLPEPWIDSQWRGDLLSLAQRMLRDDDATVRIRALELTHRFRQDSDDLVFEHFLRDGDESVRQRARRLLGGSAAERLRAGVQEALAIGDRETSRLLAVRVKELHDSALDGSVCESAAHVLDTGTPEACVAAILVIATLYSEYSDKLDFGELSQRARAALERHGIEATWMRFSDPGRSLPEEERGFMRLVVDAFEDQPDQFSALVTMACELWPDDLLMAARRVLIAMSTKAAAAEALVEMEARFGERISDVWLAEQFEQVERYSDALRHYRRAVERDPEDAKAHLGVGWLAFLDGDLITSIESTRRALELDPAMAIGEFNLGLALIAARHATAADAAYRRGVSLARRLTPSEARSTLQSAIDDLARVQNADTESDVGRVCAWLRAEQDRVETPES